ncbi:hypothetical protein [Hymenobacter wooponensis]|nr:hypothetical protein [Hymenobacter wooponensis]
MTILLKEGYQTYLNKLLLPIREQVEKLNWLVTGLECWGEYSPSIETWQAKGDSKPYYSVVSGEKFYEAFVGWNMQVIWGVFCGIVGDIPAIPAEEVPYADCNRRIWCEPEAFQLTVSAIEIIAFDSTFTLLNFRDEKLGFQFLESFPKGRIIRTPDDMLTSYQ